MRGCQLRYVSHTCKISVGTCKHNACQLVRYLAEISRVGLGKTMDMCELKIMRKAR